MAGHVRRHGGKYQAVVIDGYGRGADRRFGHLHRRKGDAVDELVMMQAELLTGVFVDRQAGKVSLVERMRQDIARRTDWSYNMTVSANNAVMHVERFFGTRSIAAIKHSDMQAFVSSLDLAPSTVETMFGHVKATIRSAMADGIIGRDPTFKVKPRTETGAPREHPHPFPGSSARRRHTL